MEEDAEGAGAGVPDMTLMPQITEEAINDNLRARYERDQIYTYTGSILIAVNPYKELGYYSTELMQGYRGRTFAELPPHVFALAEAAYKSLQSGEKNQSVVISGESGAGKTETTKLILQYLCAAGGQATWAEQQILEANTVLEAFGNAKTVRNDNSSRFGKFVEVRLDSKGGIRGAVLRDFLLERARITGPAPRETNYHVFYQLVNGARHNQELAESLCLRPGVHFTYLRAEEEEGGGAAAAGAAEEDARRLDALRLALTVLQVAPHMLEGLFKVLAAILWLGNIQFEDVDGEHSALSHEDTEAVNAVSSLLGIALPTAQRVLLERQINVRGNVTDIPLRLPDARENRHGMARALYARTFAWLVRHVNGCSAPGREASRALGVLDIFGFENFAKNSLEQLCINYANEKLHMFFNNYVFSLEQEIYRQEGIVYNPIQYTDNAVCLELLEKPPRSLLKLLSEQCHMPKGSDSAYLTNIQGEFEEHPNFVKGPRRRWEEEFSVDHYAGAVAYNVQGFVDKNRDTQQDAFVDHLSRANNPFVRELADYVQDLSPPTQEYGSCSPGTNTTQRGTSKGRPTVVDTFRAQLQSLVDMLQATDVWYVRCIKPNTSKEAGKYNQALVREQLKYLGMLEIVRIRRDGFPVHLPISEFVSKYRCLLQHPRPKEPAISEIMAVVVASQNDWQVGHSKVFMRSSVHAPLEAKRTALVQASALRLQKWYKGSMERCRYCVTRRAVITLQSAWRGWRERAAFLRLRRSTLTLQRHLRGAFAREVAAALREMRRVEREMALREERNRQAEKASQELAQLAQVRGLAATAASCGTPPSAGADSVNLDNLFDFLADVSGQQRGAPDGESANHQPTIAEIGDTMDRLAGEMDDELEQVIQAEKLDDICVRPEVGPGKVDVLERCGDGAPRDAYPPPPPPIGPPPPPPLIEMNGIDTPKPKVSSSKTNGTGEPIYEAVIPRTEPPTTLEPLPPPPPLEPPPPTQMSPPQYANGYRAMPGSGSPSPTSDALPLPPTLTNGTLSRSPSPPPPPPHDDFSLAPPTPAVSPPPIDNGFMQNPERDARRKVRVEKRLNQMETPAQLNGQPADAGHDLIHYAKNFFNEHPRSPDGTIIATLTRKSKAMEAMSKEEMLCYHKGNTIPTSHIQLHDPDSVAAACSIFRDLCRYMRGELTPDKETQVIQSIIAKGLEREELRDEILVQCMRQITDCPSVEWSERVWLILCLAAVAWQAGRGLARYYVWWLRGCLRSAQVASRPAHCAQWCLDNCRGAAPRALPPSTVEIAAMRRLGTIVCRFFFLDGRTKAIDVHPADTAAAAAARLADKLELSAGARQGWAVYQQRPAGEEHVRGHHYLYDVIAAWEMQQGAGGGSADNRFVFKRRLFRGGRELPHDPVEVALLYAQAVHSVVKLDEFPVSEKVALQLAGLQAQVSLGEPPPVSPTAQSRTAYADASQFMPQRIARSRPQNQWATILAQAHRQYGAGRAELTAKALYLSCVMQYPLYGVTLFPVIYKGYWPHGPSVLLGVGAEGIVLVRPTDKVVLAEHRYPDIAALLMDPVDDCLTISLAHHAHHDGHRCIVLETSQKCEAAWLIASYSPALGAALAEEPSRRAAPAAERARLAAALRAARRAAAHAGLLRKPSDTHGGFLRNTLKRLSKHRLDRMKVDSTESQNESYKGFPPDWWAWSRSLTHSLTRLNEAEEVAAMQMFKDIMTHAGFHVGAGNTSSNGSTGSLTTATIKEVEGEDRMTLAQALLQRCLQKDTLLCELYMQLIIQTTEHPEARSCSAARHWSMLCACAGTALPPARPLRRLLLAHLRYHGLDHIGEMGKFARFAEQVALATAASTSRRQLAPSREELLCAAARRPLHARVLLLDGRQHGLVFGPSTTASQLVQMLREKIGLSTTATGYALYEVCGSAVGGGERALAAAERAADVLARWERGGATAAARRLVFKKRLFLGERPLQAACAAERELLYHQVLHALRHDRLPIDTDEAVMLAALHAQAVSGDCAGGVEECGEAARAVLPARLTLPAPAVRMHHLALRGTLPAHAMQRALTLAQSWPLHRATIFDVMQSFTSNWPRALWLAVDVRGLTLLRHRTRQALVSYDHEQLLAVSPAPRALLLVTAAERKQSKVVLSTDQAYQIATLIKDYIEIVRGPVTPALAPPEATAANQNVQCTISQQPQQVS